MEAHQKGRFGVVFLNRHRFLQDDRAGVHLVGYEVDGAPRDLYPVGESVSHRVHPAAERGQQGWVHVHDAVSEVGNELGHEDLVETRVHYQLNIVLDEAFHYRPLLGHPVLVFGAGEGEGGDTAAAAVGEPWRIRVVGDHHPYLSLEGPLVAAGEDSLQVGALAGDEHTNREW